MSLLPFRNRNTNRHRGPASAFVAAWPLLWDSLRPHIAWVLLAVLLVFLGRAASLFLPGSTKYFVDDVLINGDRSNLWTMLVAIVCAISVHAAAHFGSAFLLTWVGLKLVEAVQCKVQAHAVRLPAGFFDGMLSGALARRITDDPAGARHFLRVGLGDFFGSLLVGVYSLIFLFQISKPLTLASLAALCVLTLITRGYSNQGPLFVARMKQNSELSGRLIQSIGGIRLVKIYGAEDYEAEVFARGARSLRETGVLIARAILAVSAAATVTIGLATLGITYLATTEVIAGRLTLGGLVTFLAFLPFLMAPMSQLPVLGAAVAEGLESLARVRGLLLEVQEGASPRRTCRLGRIRGTVSFSDVSFAYPGRTQHAVDNVSFEAEPGTVTALVGPSGAGKSTIIGLIAGFYEISAGTVRIDGVDISTVQLDTYRRQLAAVLQDVFLFDGTIRDNVAFARPDSTREEIEEACRLAHVAEFAERLPLGYDTIVGERGIKLSVGQRQRVSIARAVLADARILILDEATSNLDSESELAIQAGMEYLKRGRTTFVVAHRLSTIRGAEQILFIENGRLIERGTHASLLAKQARYYDLCLRQGIGVDGCYDALTPSAINVSR